MINIARLFIIIGIIMLVTGGLIFVFTKSGIQFSRLPGDIQVGRGNSTCIFALGTSLLLSLLLTLFLNLLARLLR